MAGSAGGASITLVVLLTLQGLVALLVALLNVVTSRALGQDFLPWESAFIPGGFGVLCLIAAVGLMRSSSGAKMLAAVAQFLVLAGGVIGLVSSAQTVLWVAVGLGVLGLLLLRRTPGRAQA